MGRLGLVGFVASFMGTFLLAVSGNFGFLAPVLAAEAPETIDAITYYPPVVGLNGTLVIAFILGFAIFGTAIFRVGTLPRLSGVLVAVGAPLQLIGFGLAQVVSPLWWPFALVGSLAFGVGLAWPGYQIWRNPRISNA
jgi:hypothetical protein